MLVLYSTVGCHLCDDALNLIYSCCESGITCEKVDIADEDKLLERYGLRIPVVKHIKSGGELDWPFNEGEFVSWLRKCTP